MPARMPIPCNIGRSSRRRVRAAVAVVPAPPADSSAPAPHQPPPPANVSLAAIAAFVGPSIGIWVAGPLLSIVDTSVIGLSSTRDLAALGPATSLCDSSSYLFSFLAVAATSLVARSVAAGSPEQAQAALSATLSTAAWSGAALGAALIVIAPSAMALYTGDAAGLLAAPAAVYVRIRALGMPFAVAQGVAQAGFLASKKTRMPLLTVALAAAANLVGDLLLCYGLGLGLAGAAWATTLSQALAAVVIVCAAQRESILPSGPRLLPSPPAPLVPPAAQLRAQWAIGGPVCALIAVKARTVLGCARAR